MKMSESQLCCDKCFDVIAKQDTNCARLWVHLCDLQNVSGGAFALKTTDFAQLRTLELMRFIVTNEVPDWIWVKVRTAKEKEESYFCGGSCGHQGL